MTKGKSERASMKGMSSTVVEAEAEAEEDAEAPDILRG